MENNKNINLESMISKPKYIKILQKIFKALGAIIIIIIIFAILFLGSIAIKSMIGKEETSSVFGYTVLRIASGSMEETLETGDVILIKNTNIDELSVGDIISFENESGTITTHRIIDISLNKSTGQKEITTKGDNNNTEDANKVTEDNIKGKYLLKIKGLGTFMDFMETTLGFACIIFFPIMALVFIIIKEKKSADRKAMRKEKMLNYNIQQEGVDLENFAKKVTDLYQDALTFSNKYDNLKKKEEDKMEDKS